MNAGGEQMNRYRASKRALASAVLAGAIALGGCTGERERSPARASAPEPIRIVALGDSTTEAGWEGNAEIVYAERLEASLEARGFDVEVINAGLSGTTSEQAVERLDADVRRHRPHYVIVQFGINDSWIDADEGRTDPRLSVDEFDAQLSAIIETLRADGARPILMTPNPMRWSEFYGREYWDHPELGFDAEDPRGINRLLDVYAQRVRDVARRKSVPLVDVSARFEAYDRSPGRSISELLLPNDDIHPNDAGHALIAEWLTELLAADLEPR